MNRQDFREIAYIRLREAKVLLRNRQYSGAYYLCGYVVECALKACIAKQTRRYEFPDKKKGADSFTHDLKRLMELAGLEADLNAKAGSDAVFGGNWLILRDWSEQSRYKKWSKSDAEVLYDAVTDAANGVFPWIQGYW
jgi:HEPN domain-containing protein